MVDLSSTSLQRHPGNEERLSWLRSPDVRPYVFVRSENRIPRKGVLHQNLDWFPHSVLYKNPLEMGQLEFANRILNLETRAFGPSGMAMPRWVFYDCAVVPGFVAGFAARARWLKPRVREALGLYGDLAEIEQKEEWVPLSLFIIIPTMSRKGEWVAHNLCSMNSIVDAGDRFYGIGFLSKAFGLWYANVRTCCGMTQWTSPSVKLHSHYGEFEVLTAFTPVHSYAHTLTYRVEVDSSRWIHFFRSTDKAEALHTQRQTAGFCVEPREEDSLRSFQNRLESGEGPYFLDGTEILRKPIGDSLQVYC